MVISAGAIETNPVFRIGDVLGRSFALLWGYFLPLVLIGGASMVPYLWVMFTGMDFAPLHRVAPVIPYGLSANFTVSRAASFLIRCFCEALIVRTIFQRMRRLPVKVGDLAVVGLISVLPVTVISICQSAGLLIGDLLLGRPGWMARGVGALVMMPAGVALAMMWFVAPSICVVERLGAVASLRRGAKLTRGHKRRILMLFLVIAIPSVIMGVIANRVLAATANRALYAVVEYATQGIYIALSTIVGVVIYTDLKTAKEGAETGRVARVFE